MVGNDRNYMMTMFNMGYMVSCSTRAKTGRWMESRLIAIRLLGWLGGVCDPDDPNAAVGLSCHL